MLLMINGELRTFEEIQNFRAEQHLPDEFSMNFFSPKDYTDLGNIQGAGSALNALRHGMLDAIPVQMSIHQWLGFVPELQQTFGKRLHAINTQIGLKEVEIDFAVAGFGDVCHTYIYNIIRAKAENKATPDFRTIYQDWLNSSVKIFPNVHTFQHEGKVWEVQVVAHAYGRAGLIVNDGQNTYYLHDPSAGCPAEGFMHSLLSEIAVLIYKARD